VSLDAYRHKRNFAATPEPEGGGASGNGRAFVVQKHAARRLHYDLRLEHDGVLWSWAVTRGPSLDPGDKRLAVRTEDHPLDYASFEGTIPKPQYGAGAVLVWDRGSWAPKGDPAHGEAKGHLEFTLKGRRLRGRWHLVRMARRPREKTDNWLLIKVGDAEARDADAPDILEEEATSVLTGRTIEEIAEGAAPKRPRRRQQRKKADAAFPGFVEPALATLRPKAPTGEAWLHEIKFDGYRIQAHLRGGEARLLTRSGLDWTDRFQPVADALGALPASAILDGEIVVEDASGVSDFSALQADLAEGRADRFAYYAFDLLHEAGDDLRPLPLTERKDRLAQFLAPLLSDAPAAIRYSEHFHEEGEVMLRHACRLSLEGLVSKRHNSPYRSGRSRDWIKLKCLNREEFVILGYAPAANEPEAIGALLLGEPQGDGFTPAGRVGTGFTRAAAEDLHRRLAPLTRKPPAFPGRHPADLLRDIRFVEPRLVAQIEYLARTREGTLRHASFRGLREDKLPEALAPPSEPKAPAAQPAADRPAQIAKLTNPDRLYWPDAGVTKEGLAEHYAAAWRRIAPHVVNRPLALLRCPNGVGGQCFFQKHAWRGQSREILTLTDPLDKGADTTITAIDDLKGLLGIVQGGALEIHTWQSSTLDIERPDQIVMDLDPDDAVDHDAVVAATIEVRDRLAAAGLPSFLKTTGGKGYHVVAPLEPKAGWADVKSFAKSIADGMAADAPDRYVATISKAKRRGRILIDYLRNGRGATAVAPYSTRARDGATVSMPLAWEELAPPLHPAFFTVPNTPARLAGAGDPWADFRAAATPLPEAKKRRRR
jgi:bifunctional non-homologous end joining protein LigD